MDFKWIGAILIVISCAGFGLSLVAVHKREENALRQLAAALDFMECELQYRLTPLPELCRQTGIQCGGEIKFVFTRLAEELEYQISPDVAGCMAVALASCGQLPENTRENLVLLGNSLGRFDLEGQLRSLEAVRENCRDKLCSLSENRDVRLRSYQTLGLCAGAALVILFI